MLITFSKSLNLATVKFIDNVRGKHERRENIYLTSVRKLDKTLFSLTYNFPSIYLVKNARTDKEVLK